MSTYMCPQNPCPICNSRAIDERDQLRADNEALRARLEEAERLLRKLTSPGWEPVDDDAARAFLASDTPALMALQGKAQPAASSPAAAPTCGRLIGSLNAPCTKPRNHGGDCEHDVRRAPASAQGTGGSAKKHYAHHLQVSQMYALNQACETVWTAFEWDEGNGHCGIYHVGSSLKRRDWRDVDVRCILDDERFDRMFPGAAALEAQHQLHPLLALVNVSISEWLSRRTGLPVDFQVQRMTEANAKYSPKEGHIRSALRAWLPARPKAEPAPPRSAPVGTHAFFDDGGGDFCRVDQGRGNERYQPCGQPRSAAVHDTEVRR